MKRTLPSLAIHAVLIAAALLIFGFGYYIYNMAREGLHLELQSFKSLVAGGISFRNPPRPLDLILLLPTPDFPLYNRPYTLR